jgi:hypothetical protein
MPSLIKVKDKMLFKLVHNWLTCEVFAKSISTYSPNTQKAVFAKRIKNDFK